MVKKTKKKKIAWEHIGERTLFWTPRIILILFIIFLSLFAFDVWVEPGSFWLKFAGFLIHLIPSFLLAGLLYVAWKWEKVGSVLLFCIAVFMTFFFDTLEDPFAFLFVSLPVFIISGLFYWHYVVNPNLSNQRLFKSKKKSKKKATKKSRKTKKKTKKSSKKKK